ncbi:PREDICTED: tripartite motif-containing protein 47-like [Cyprinodon variegatus]|uniref:Tripartite motif-containing protein 47-like n=1 Tax=Cyprinodon variegatus TaxID=28743 RepID=A0A3Q2EH24_CYPVA|nr:PREDICTED: tripartite motif-containing protein 47-like [Cyprinodon variegatus]
MSVITYQLADENFWCCICQDVFVEPVTLPCGHNFCRACIEKHLDLSPRCQCPICNERVNKKHKLVVNTIISELTIQYLVSAGQKRGNNSKPVSVTPGEPSRDPPVGPKHLPSWSYLLLAVTMVALLLFFMARRCSKHHNYRELFSKNEQINIRQSTWASSNRFHQGVPSDEKYEEKQEELWKTSARIQHLIWQRWMKIKEIKDVMQLREEAAEREMTDGIQIFTSLIQTLKNSQAYLIGMVEEKQRVKEKQMRSVIAELEQEISKLKRRHVQLELLSHFKELLVFQDVHDLSAVPPTKDWTQEKICPIVYEGLIRKAMERAMDQLSEVIRQWDEEAAGN